MAEGLARLLLTDDTPTGLASDRLGARDGRAVDAGTVSQAATALLEVGLRVDALEPGRDADLAGDLARGARLGRTLASASTLRRGKRADELLRVAPA